MILPHGRLRIRPQRATIGSKENAAAGPAHGASPEPADRPVVLKGRTLSQRSAGSHDTRRNARIPLRRLESRRIVPRTVPAPDPLALDIQTPVPQAHVEEVPPRPEHEHLSLQQVRIRLHLAGPAAGDSRIQSAVTEVLDPEVSLAGAVGADSAARIEAARNVVGRIPGTRSPATELPHAAARRSDTRIRRLPPRTAGAGTHGPVRDSAVGAAETRILGRGPHRLQLDTVVPGMDRRAREVSPDLETGPATETARTQPRRRTEPVVPGRMSLERPAAPVSSSG